MSDVDCPHCGHTQSDVHNGGDPAEWWNCSEIPDGSVIHECDSCRVDFRVVINWSPEFTPEIIKEDEN